MYRHTQTGTLMVAVLGAGLAVLVAVFSFAPFEADEKAARWIILPAALVMGVAGVVFRSLTITVGSGELA